MLLGSNDTTSPLHLENYSGEIIFKQEASHIHLAAVGQINMSIIHSKFLALLLYRPGQWPSVVTGDNVTLSSTVSFVRLLCMALCMIVSG